MKTTIWNLPFAEKIMNQIKKQLNTEQLIDLFHIRYFDLENLCNENPNAKNECDKKIPIDVRNDVTNKDIHFRTSTNSSIAIKKALAIQEIKKLMVSVEDIQEITEHIDSKNTEGLINTLTRLLSSEQFKALPYTESSILIDSLNSENISYITTSELNEIGRFLADKLTITYNEKEHLFTDDVYIDQNDYAAIQSRMEQIVKSEKNSLSGHYYEGYDHIANQVFKKNESIQDELNELIDDAYILTQPTLNSMIQSLLSDRDNDLIIRKSSFCQRYNLNRINDCVDYIQDEIYSDFFNIESDLTDVYETAYNTELNVALVLNTSEDFNSEFSNDTYGYYYEPDEETPNAIQRFAEKEGYTQKQLADALETETDIEPLRTLAQEIENGYDNSTLIVPLKMKWTDIAYNLINYNRSITLNRDYVETLGLISYVHGSGSVFEIQCKKDTDIVYKGNEWTLLIEGTFGYEMDKIYGGGTFDEYAKTNDATRIFAE